jgi:hypothetical protein
MNLHSLSVSELLEYMQAYVSTIYSASKTRISFNLKKIFKYLTSTSIMLLLWLLQFWNLPNRFCQCPSENQSLSSHIIGY